VSGRRAPSLNTFCVGVAVVVGCVVGVAWGVWLVVVNKIPTIASSNLFLLGIEFWTPQDVVFFSF
jgi:hypothetical protein